MSHESISNEHEIIGRIPKKKVIINLNQSGLRKINLERKGPSQNKFGTKRPIMGMPPKSFFSLYQKVSKIFSLKS